MDRRLVEAARTGNVDYFLRLMEQDSLVLDNVSLFGAETPLHIASICGHLLFVQNVLKIRKQLACEKNQDGFSPLHLASANGHVEVVKELLKLEGEYNLSTIQGPEQRTALHCAVVKERIEVITELMSASPDSVEMKTIRGETALHLAVKNNQIGSFKMLVGYLKQHKKVNLLNEKDNQGNSILHLAASRRQYEASPFFFFPLVIETSLILTSGL